MCVDSGHVHEQVLRKSICKMIVVGTPDFIVETPDLGRIINGGGHELKQLDGQFSFFKSSFTPSGPISVDKFFDHVEKFDSNRQLLFQEEYDVSQSGMFFKKQSLHCTKQNPACTCLY